MNPAVSRDELNRLLNAMIPFAQDMLGKYGQFVPFAGVLNAEGEIELLGGFADNENVTAQEIHDVLLDGLQQSAREGKYRATGLCADVHVRRGQADQGSDAIGVSLEHSDGTALDVYLPYTKPAPGQIEYGELFGAGAAVRVFTAPPAPPPA